MPQMPGALQTKKWIHYTVNHPFRILFIFFALTLFFALQIPGLHFKTSIYDMAIEDLPETEKYRQFKEAFGSEELILVVLRAENIFDQEVFQRIEHLTNRFSKIKGVRRVISLTSIKKDMELSEKWDLEYFESIAAPIDFFEKNLISTDKKTTAITLILEDIEEKESIIREIDGVIQVEKNGKDLYQIGMPVISKAMAEYVERDFKTIPPFTFLIIAVILFCIFKTIRGLLIPAGSVLIALVWTFGLMALTGTPLSMLTMIVPIFVIAVGTAYCMYIFPEYLEAARVADSPKEAALSCLHYTSFPTVLAVLTTSIGLGSLLLNRINSIRDFALFSTAGIWSIVLLILFFVPAVLSILPLPKSAAKSRPKEKGVITGLLRRIITVNLKHQKTALPIIAGLSLFGIVGIFQIKVETNPLEFFKKNTVVSRHFHDVYKDLSGSVPINIVLDGKEPDFFEDPKNLKMVAEIQEYIATLDGMDKSVSFADYFRLVNYASNKYQTKFYSLPDEAFEVRMIMNNYKSMLGRDMFERFMTPDLSKTNILIRTHLSSSNEFLKAQKTIQGHLRGILPEAVDYQVTGFGIVISQSSTLLTKGQIRSLSVTLVLIFGIMFVLFLSTKVGFIAILPNCFPIIMNFGLMGWLGIELSVATSLIASIAIGLAVDDTIHYLVRYNREFKEDLKKGRALEDTILSVGRPILFTTLTIGIGFSVLVFSHFKPTAVFGLMMVITMASALVADMVLLPSLMGHVELITVWDLLRLKMGKDPRKGIPLFDGLTRNQAHYILMAGTIVNMKGGEVLFRKGEMSDSMYAVISGELEVVDMEEEADGDITCGTKKLINTIQKGGIVGEMGMVRSCHRSATVISTAPTELLQINRRMISRLHWLYPPTAQKFFFNLMSVVCNRLERTTQRLSDITIIDSLTGLNNREYFMGLLEKELSRVQRYHTGLSIVLLDLDNFKGVNHTYGHETGDLVLQQIGLFISNHIRKSDHTCRYRGQQFAVTLINASPEETRKICERFLKILSEHSFKSSYSPLHITASIGFVTLTPSLNESPAELMQMASKALQEAKKNGRNRVEEYA